QGGALPTRCPHARRGRDRRGRGGARSGVGPALSGAGLIPERAWRILAWRILALTAGPAAANLQLCRLSTSHRRDPSRVRRGPGSVQGIARAVAVAGVRDIARTERHHDPGPASPRLRGSRLRLPAGAEREGDKDVSGKARAPGL